MAYFSLTLLLVLFTIQAISAQIINCRRDWQNHDKCLQNRRLDYKKSLELTNAERDEMRSKIKMCYFKQDCKDPFISSYETSIKTNCYKQVQTKLKNSMQMCITKKFNEFSLPSDSDVANGIGQDMLNMRTNPCKPKDPVSFGKCLGDARGFKGTNPTFKNAPYCQVRQECYKLTSYREACFSRAQQIRPQMCQCAKKLPISEFVQQYKTCLKNWRIAIKNESTDYNLVLLKNINKTRFAAFCNETYTDQCGGFKSIDLKSTTITSPPPASKYKNETTLPPPPKISNDLTAPGAVDFGSLMTSGNIFPTDASQIVQAAGLGEFPTGADASSFDLTQLFGQSFDLGTFLSTIDLKSILSNFFGFGSLDLSSLFGTGFNSGVFGGEAARIAESVTTTTSDITTMETIETTSI